MNYNFAFACCICLSWLDKCYFEGSWLCRRTMVYRLGSDLCGIVFHLVYQFWPCGNVSFHLISFWYITVSKNSSNRPEPVFLIKWFGVFVDSESVVTRVIKFISFWLLSFFRYNGSSSFVVTTGLTRWVTVAIIVLFDDRMESSSRRQEQLPYGYRH